MAPPGAAASAAPPPRRLQVAVVGAGAAGPELTRLATEVGTRLARAGAVLITGGRSGVMAAASAGARAAGGLVLGVLPGASAADSPPNSDVELALFTGLGQARNLVVVLSGGAVIAIGGGWGTLSEVALALTHGVPVVLLHSWRLERPDGHREPLLHVADTPAAAVARALALARSAGRSGE